VIIICSEAFPPGSKIIFSSIVIEKVSRQEEAICAFSDEITILAGRGTAAKLFNIN
jgi:hypothetical protein